MSAAPAAPGVAPRLRGVRVGVRADLEISRHCFRGDPCYIVRDPVTFQSHRLDPADYQVLIRIHDGRSLGDTFAELVREGLTSAESEEAFYGFIQALHRLGFLALPVADDKALYQRFEARRSARQRRWFMSLLFLQIPLWQPDPFLGRTVGAFRFLFQRWFFACWTLMAVAAIGVVASRWGEFMQPLNGLLATSNLAAMWLSLIVLKAIHEFGHAYACKHFGVHVPEMGLYLMVGTPCAYVDASGAWGLSSRRDRLIISLAGMYFESIVASLAVFAWAASGPGMVQSLAYNTIFLAGVVTVLFNLNPLMRYDGYYILSDLLELPNLRQRANERALTVLRHRLLGVRAPAPRTGPGMNAFLACFGIAAGLYKVSLTLGIAALIATKAYLLGFVLGGAYAAHTLWDMLRRSCHYCWFSPQTAPVRGRAIAVSAALAIGLPLGIAAIPLPGRVIAAGVVHREHEIALRAPAPALLVSSAVAPGERVRAGDALVRLQSDPLDEAARLEAAELEALLRRHAALRPDDAAAARELEESIAGKTDRLRRRQFDLVRCEMKAPFDGVVLSAPSADRPAQFFRTGDAVLRLGGGGCFVHAALSAEEFSRARPQIGQAVAVRLAGRTDQILRGVIERVDPAGTPRLEDAALTQLGGGSIAVDPASEIAAQAYYHVRIRLPEDAGARDVPIGQLASVRFSADAEALGTQWMRKLRRFIDSLAAS